MSKRPTKLSAKMLLVLQYLDGGWKLARYLTWEVNGIKISDSTIAALFRRHLIGMDQQGGYGITTAGRAAVMSGKAG